MNVSLGKTAMWGGIHVLLLLSLLVPLVNFVTIHFLVVPLMVMFVISDMKRFALVLGGLLLVFVLLPSGLFLLVLTAFYLPAALAMGWQYRRGATPSAAVLAGIVAFIAVMLVLLVIVNASGVDVAGSFKQAVMSDPNVMAMLGSVLTSEEQLDQALRLMTAMLPTVIIVFALYNAVLAQWLGRKVLGAVWRPVDGLKPMREWRLPRSLVFCYLIALVFSMFGGFNIDSTLGVIMLNAIPLLMYAFALQGAGFLFFLASVKGWGKALPIIALVLIVVSPLAQLMAWLGVVDVAFPLRNKLNSRV